MGARRTIEGEGKDDEQKQVVKAARDDGFIHDAARGGQNLPGWATPTQPGRR